VNRRGIPALFLVAGLLFLMEACNLLPAPTPPPTPAVGSSPASPTLPKSTDTPTPVPATPSPTQTPTPEPTPTPTPTPVLRFGVIGDYGDGGQGEADVAALVHSWAPDLIITVGDNNYPLGEAGTIDAHIGQYYQDFIFPYTGAYGPGAAENRFFPSLGNHDWYTAGAQPYFDYFSLPGNERYYDFMIEPVHFFALDSDENEPDGFRSNSVQAAWLQQELAGSTSPWNIVYFHHAPYTSGAYHGSTTWLRWPFAAWGAQAVLSGHEHSYERLLVDGIPYFVNGVGGGGRYDFLDILPESQFRYNADYGAMLVTATNMHLLFEFFNRTGQLIDQYELQKP
jgi:tartrate-resistant acid phosphatase type 5